MQAQVRKALDQIINAFQLDNLQFCTFLRQSLLKIIASITEQQQQSQQLHRIQIQNLKRTISQKQNQIVRLTQKICNETENGKNNKKQQPITPYKILIKNNNNIQHFLQNQSNAKNMLSLQHQENNSNVLLNRSQNRFSLQLISGSGSKTSRFSSSNIKNKIIHQNTQQVKNGIIPQSFEKHAIEGAYTTDYLKQSQSNSNINKMQDMKKQRSISSKQQLTRPVFKLQSKQNQKQRRMSTKLFRKPNNKSKRQLLARKKDLEVATNNRQKCQTTRVRCVDVTIPVKLINVLNVKPR